MGTFAHREMHFMQKRCEQSIETLADVSMHTTHLGFSSVFAYLRAIEVMLDYLFFITK